MRPEVYSTPLSPLCRTVAVLTLLPLVFPSPACASVLDDLHSNYFDPAPSPEDGPPGAAGALRNTAFLPAQIGGIVGSYAVSLIVVAAVLLLLAKRRRDHLTAADDDLDPYSLPYYGEALGADLILYPDESPISPTEGPRNFSYPTYPTLPSSPGFINEPKLVSVPSFPSEKVAVGPYVHPPPQSSSTLGINPLVDPRVVAADREMAQNQLEEMYKHVMDQEAAKEAGVAPPPVPASRETSMTSLPKPSSVSKKGKLKPANLDLDDRDSEKTQSRSSSFFSALKSPRKKTPKAINISSPIMTPMSGTFPRQDGEEMNSIPPRHYAPAAPPPVPTNQQPMYRDSRQSSAMAPITPPDLSPESTQSIDERLGNQFGRARTISQEIDPISAVSERSTTPLVGLPSSPKPGVNRMPSLPASPKPGATFPSSPRPGATFPSSPKPGATFSRPNAPSAVRTGGALPLRAYEPAPSAVRTGGALPLRAYEQPLASPSIQTTKQTTFERTMPLSPSGLRTPWTGAPTPYSPYQPFSPVVPVTPSLVTKADRKRMRQMQPKTPTVEMVKSSDDLW